MWYFYSYFYISANILIIYKNPVIYKSRKWVRSENTRISQNFCREQKQGKENIPWIK